MATVIRVIRVVSAIMKRRSKSNGTGIPHRFTHVETPWELCRARQARADETLTLTLPMVIFGSNDDARRFVVTRGDECAIFKVS